MNRVRPVIWMAKAVFLYVMMVEALPDFAAFDQL